jgi:hypothetical protein
VDYPKDLDYNQAQPWNNINDANYYNNIRESLNTKKRYKALYYKDIRLWIIQNPTPRGRNLVIIEITLKYHKGVNKKPKP